MEGGLDTEGLLDGLLARVIKLRWIFSLWGLLKDHVYAFLLWNIEDMVAGLKQT
jgi:hypothetical protein